MCEFGPNILLFLCDQLTARAMRLYGGPVPMPNLERLAAGGVVFERAYASSVACGPSHACLFTGQYPHSHGIAHNVALLQRLTQWQAECEGAREAPGVTTSPGHEVKEKGPTP